MARNGPRTEIRWAPMMRGPRKSRWIYCGAIAYQKQYVLAALTRHIQRAGETYEAAKERARQMNFVPVKVTLNWVAH